MEPIKSVASPSVTGETQLTQEPPQSAPVSWPLRTPSLQVGAWHTVRRQTWLMQSLGSAQLRVSAHGAQMSPPQSTLVSVPLCWPSPQPLLDALEPPLPWEEATGPELPLPGVDAAVEDPLPAPLVTLLEAAALLL